MEKYINKETDKIETYSDIKKSFEELKANTNEFDFYCFEDFLSEYYKKI